MSGIRMLCRLICLGICLGAGILGATRAEARDKAILVLDASGSMWGQVDGKAKWTIAKDAVDALVAGWDTNIDLGLTLYGHRAKGACDDIEDVIPVGPVDPAKFRAAVDKVSPKGKTPMTAAVKRAAEALKYTEDAATVILVSDGEETCDLDPCAIATELEQKGVAFTAHVIGFDIRDPAAIEQLKCIAENTGGTFVEAHDAASLNDALATVAAATATPAPPPAPAPAPAAEAPRGRPTFSAVYAEGQPAEDPAMQWKLYADVPGADPATAEPGRVLYGVGSPTMTPNKDLEPGDYLVRVRLGAVTVTERVTLTGRPQSVVIDLKAAVITATAQAIEGGPMLEKDVVWALFAGDKKIAGTVAPTGRFIVPEGEYRLTVKKDEARGETPLSVKPGDKPEVTLILNAGTLEGEMRPSESEPPATKDVAWKIYPAGTDKRIASSYSGSPSIMLPAGTYRVTASQGNTTGEATIEVKPGETTKVSIVLGAGVLKPTAIFAPGVPKPTRDLSWRVYPAALDLEGKRGAAVASSYELTPTLKLPAGKYYVEVRSGKATVGAEVEITAGAVAAPELNLNAGAILGSATMGGAKLAKGLSWTVYTLVDAMTGPERSRIESSYDAEPTWILPAGTYVVTVKSGGKTVEAEVTVIAGKPARVTLALD
ncbi:MAG: VWA domain-containing protein [Zavarzinia sp.]|nr:VWA domain-containing protein [Zavarzinia sp.]